jgi:NADH-quinone oxidoreductase subunit L
LIYSAWVLWLVPLACAPFVPVVGALNERLRGWLAVSATGTGFAASVYCALTYSGPATESLGPWFQPLGAVVSVDVDGLSVLVSVLVSFVSLLVVVYSLGYMKDERGQSRYYSLVLVFVGSMLGLVMSGSLVQLYFFWELVGVCSALLIAFWTEKPEARRAGMKAFVVTRLGDSAFLVAVVLAAALFGTTAFSALLGPGGVATLGGGAAFALGLLIFLGAMGKSAQVPLHGWLPDAMEGPTTVSALIHAATMVNAGVFVVLRMFPLFALPQLSGALLDLVLVVGLVSALVGGLSAFAADDIKRLLAYSTISQLGLMFAAIGMGSLEAGAYQMLSQGLFKALAFLAAGSVIGATGTRDMAGMGGLAGAMKVTYASFLIAALAMVGLPPLVGFWSKEGIFTLALGAGAVQGAAVLGVFALTTLYSFRAVFRVFHGPRMAGPEPREPSASMTGPMVALAAALLTGWALFQSQGLVPFTAFWAVEPFGLMASLATLAACSAGSYLACDTYRDEAIDVLRGSRILRASREALFNGFWFDSLYEAVSGTVTGRLARLAAAVQTGSLSWNLWLLLGLVGAVFGLFATGVL